MSDKSVVYVRMDTELKENAESILKQLGLTPSAAIQMYYSQIVLRKGIPLDVALPMELEKLRAAPSSEKAGNKKNPLDEMLEHYGKKARHS